jgi:hypothetical protein
VEGLINKTLRTELNCFRFNVDGHKFEIARFLNVQFEKDEFPPTCEGEGDPFGEAHADPGGVGKIVRAPAVGKARPRAFKRYDPYAVPKEMWEMVERGGDLSQKYCFLSQPLEPQNYKSKFRCLVYLQHIGEALTVAKMGLSRVSLGKERENLLLDVDGLKDGRPSLLVYDTVIVSGYRRLGSEC